MIREPRRLMADIAVRRPTNCFFAGDDVATQRSPPDRAARFCSISSDLLQQVGQLGVGISPMLPLWLLPKIERDKIALLPPLQEGARCIAGHDQAVLEHEVPVVFLAPQPIDDIALAHPRYANVKSYAHGAHQTFRGFAHQIQFRRGFYRPQPLKNKLRVHPRRAAELLARELLNDRGPALF